jgi:uncharacterized membrane protein
MYHSGKHILYIVACRDVYLTPQDGILSLPEEVLAMLFG